MKKTEYAFHINEYIDPARFEKLKKFSEEKETPFLVIDLDIVERKYRELREFLPFAKIHYAVKANPDIKVLTLLAQLGSNFDVASIYELDMLLGLGVDPSRVLYGNTIKKSKDVAYAFQKGVRLFATDSEYDLNSIAKNAPGAKVYFRILTDGSGADWPLSRKFGAHPDLILSLIRKAGKMDVIPYGLSFHVGSQQRDIGQWDNAVSQCYYLFEAAKEVGIELKMIDIGGGFPAKYTTPTTETAIYAAEIERFLKEDFGDNMPEIIIEPGRSLVGDAGVLVSEIVLIEKKARYNPFKWMYLDVGKFSGLIETLDESIKYPMYVEKDGYSEKFIVAGPTCDSMDILYEKVKMNFPNTVAPGDRVYVFTTGAYTQSYSAVGFNGFPPLKVYVME